MTITKEMLIQDIASCENENVATVRNILSGLEQAVLDYLSSTTQSDDTVIKLFEGFQLECSYVPPRQMAHPETRKPIVVPEKIWANARVTRNLNRKLNARLHT